MKTDQDDLLKNWQLEATPLDEENEDEASGSSIPLGKLQRVAEGSYVRYLLSGVKLQSKSRFRLSLVGPPDARGTSEKRQFDNKTESIIAVTAKRMAKSLLVTGDGLQTGFDMTACTVNVRVLDQYGQGFAVANATVGWAIGAASGVILSSDSSKMVTDKVQFVYKRPPVASGQTKADYFLRVVMKSADGIFEPPESPFLLRSAVFFNDVDPASKSFW